MWMDIIVYWISSDKIVVFVDYVLNDLPNSGSIVICSFHASIYVTIYYVTHRVPQL